MNSFVHGRRAEVHVSVGIDGVLAGLVDDSDLVRASELVPASDPIAPFHPEVSE